MECLFWDFSSHNWSSEGCRLLEQESNREWSVCECNHLCAFTGILTLSEENDLLEEWMSKICCSLSMISQVMTIVLVLKKDLFFKFFGFFSKHLRKIRPKQKLNENSEHLFKIRDIIVMNESICYFVALFIILVGMDRSGNGQTTNDVSIQS